VICSYSILEFIVHAVVQFYVRNHTHTERTGGKLSPEDVITMIEKQIKFEMYYCAKLAFTHQNAKETCAALKIKLKELKQKQRDVNAQK